MMLHSRSAPLYPSFSFLNFRLFSLALLLLMTVLAGCATRPTGMPGDPVLADRAGLHPRATGSDVVRCVPLPLAR